MIDLKAIGEVVNSCASLICMCDNDNFVASINELLVSNQNCCTADSNGPDRLWTVGICDSRHHLITSVLGFECLKSR